VFGLINLNIGIIIQVAGGSLVVSSALLAVVPAFGCLSASSVFR